MAKSAYVPRTKDLPEQVEEIISQCYPVYQDEVNKLAMRFFQNARKKGHHFVTPAGARQVVLMLVLKTQGAILE